MPLRLLAPPACLACRRPPAVRGAPLCPACAAALPWLGPVCARCGLPGCGPCPARGAPFDAAWAPFAMAGPARALVHALKFDGLRPAAQALAAPMATGAPAWVPRGPASGAWAALVPVPADPWRRRRRGTDHTRLLAEALAPRLGLPVAPCLRRQAGGAQVGRGRAARQQADGRVRAGDVAPRTAVLVDDVHTTGATLRACAAAARAAGAQRVVAVTATRSLPVGATPKRGWPVDGPRT